MFDEVASGKVIVENGEFLLQRKDLKYKIELSWILKGCIGKEIKILAKANQKWSLIE